MIEHSVDTTLKIFDLLVTIVKHEGCISYYDVFTYDITYDESLDMLVYQIKSNNTLMGMMRQEMFLKESFISNVFDYALSMGIE